MRSTVAHSSNQGSGDQSGTTARSVSPTMKTAATEARPVSENQNTRRKVGVEIMDSLGTVLRRPCLCTPPGR